jgi:hypothetical protein
MTEAARKLPPRGPNGSTDLHLVSPPTEKEITQKRVLEQLEIYEKARKDYLLALLIRSPPMFQEELLKKYTDLPKATVEQFMESVHNERLASTKLRQKVQDLEEYVVESERLLLTNQVDMLSKEDKRFRESPIAVLSPVVRHNPSLNSHEVQLEPLYISKNYELGIRALQLKSNPYQLEGLLDKVSSVGEVALKIPTNAKCKRGLYGAEFSFAKYSQKPRNYMQLVLSWIRVLELEDVYRQKKSDENILFSIPKLYQRLDKTYLPKPI